MLKDAMGVGTVAKAAAGMAEEARELMFLFLKPASAAQNV
jgi:hypothetical protein